MRLAILALMALGMSGCSSSESDARKAVLNLLTDPDSAKFGQFTLVNEHGACLAVNAKNKMGGYTGEQQALLIRGDKERDNAEWQVSKFAELSHENCVAVVSTLDFSGLGDAD